MAYKIKATTNIKIPVVAARGTVVFPKMLCHLDLSRSKSIEAVRSAMEENQKLFVVTQRDISVEMPSQEDLYDIGTVVELKQLFKQTDSEYRIMVKGEYKAKLIKLESTDSFYQAEIKRIPNRRQLVDDQQKEAALRSVKHAFNAYIFLAPKMSKDFLNSVESEKDLEEIFKLIMAHVPLKFERKQEMLEENDLLQKIQLLVNALIEETSILSLEKEIFEKVQTNIDQNQREYFLREQIKIINEELGYDEYEGEENDYISKITAIENIKEDSREKLLNEAMRLSKMPPSSHEAYVITNYLDTCLDLPWDITTDDTVNIKSASKQLEKDHYGMKKVKERILENLAVRTFVPKLKGQILCLVGPPGVGKTSIASSVAKALNRNFVRISLGGVSDESEIRGHRKTYIGAMPGRIIAGIKQAKSRNPLVLLDEIDKMGSSFKGDPSSAMLEVLDGEQNVTFTDHYIDIPFDLSDCLFITTANSISNIPAPLLDRMEVIELSSYTLEEKFQICKRHLIPKQREKHGMPGKTVQFSDNAIYSIIEYYTKEAGVRKLERKIAELCRKAAKDIAEGKSKSVRFTVVNIDQYLGPKKYLREKISDTDEVGLVNGLAWTSVGGELLQIEVSIMDGKGTLQLTGNLGSVMKESANTALSYVRSVASKYGISSDFYKKKDIHIHVPEGAVPKDGPSAGVALATALISALANIPVRRDVAMTGEITLRGRDLPIGGLKEKSIAAYKSGVKTVLIPHQNKADLKEIDDVVRNALNFIPCKTAEEVLNHALSYQFISAMNTKELKRTCEVKEDLNGAVYEF